MKTRAKKYTLNTENPAPSTGKMLDTYIKEKRIYQSALCRLLNRHQTSVSTFRKTATMQTAILWEICHALKHNFFADIAAQLPPDFSTNGLNNPINPQDTELESLKAEIAQLKTEKEQLRTEKEWLEKMIDKFLDKRS
ncbi:MAG: hypothetical protein ACRCSB_00790 [Bacteroidales bacterium]